MKTLNPNAAARDTTHPDALPPEKTLLARVRPPYSPAGRLLAAAAVLATSAVAVAPAVIAAPPESHVKAAPVAGR